MDYRHWINGFHIIQFYQRGSLASYARYASAGIVTGRCPSVRPSVCHTVLLYQNKQSLFSDRDRRLKTLQQKYPAIKLMHNFERDRSERGR